MYAFNRTIDGPFDDAVIRVKDALKAGPFGVITEIDIQKTMKAKLDIDKSPCVILGACNPKLANEIIDIEADAAALLPCNVVVREEQNGDITVSFLDPVTLLGLSDNEAVKTLGQQAKQMLDKVASELSGKA